MNIFEEMVCKLASVLIIAALFRLSAAHPLCLNNAAPSNELQNQMEFCVEIKDSSNTDGGCCSRMEEEEIKKKFYDIYSLSEECKPYQRQITCGKCHPFAAHLLIEGNDVIKMSRNFCSEYMSACQSDVGLPNNFCDEHATDSYYAYPVVAEESKQLASSLSPYFSSLQGKLPTQLTGMYMMPGSDMWWMINQRGQIVEVENRRDANYTKTIVDIKYRVNQGGGEMGLLGFAFSPDFTSTGHFYLNYISNDRNTIIARYTLKIGDASATGNSEKVLMKFYQPYENHNGGTLLFSPSDLTKPYDQRYYDLYITTGDGGGANDPNNSSQNLESKLGKILRIRISTDYSRDGYDIPEGNIRNEVWAYGLRNPWKCSFDRGNVDNSELWCGDVGQNKVEEINIVKSGGNYGWKNFEGTHFSSGNNIDYFEPVYEYCHSGNSDELCSGKPFTGESVTGGFVYRGRKFATSLGGQYIFADFQTQRLLRLTRSEGNSHAASIIDNTGWKIPSLAEDNEGELYILRYGENANIYALADENTLSGESDIHTISVTNIGNCANGIVEKNVCCPTSCGTCGGYGCHLRPGGREKCCSTGILEAGKMCKNNEAPCILYNRRSLYSSERT